MVFWFEVAEVRRGARTARLGVLAYRLYCSVDDAGAADYLLACIVVHLETRVKSACRPSLLFAPQENDGALDASWC